MALYMVLEDFSGDVGTTSKGIPVSLVQAGTLLDDAQFDIPRLLADGCPVVLYNPATMGAARTAFEKMSGGLAQINPDGNLLALLFATGVISGVVGPSNVAFVDVIGGAGGMVGNAALPFATIAQALAALAVAGLVKCQVRIGPGNFIADNPPIPAALKDLSIVGSVPQTTYVQTATPGTNLFDLGVNLPRDNFNALGFTVSAPGGLAFRYDGQTQWTNNLAFAAGALSIGCPIVGGDIDIKRLGTLATVGPAFLCFGACTLAQVSQELAFDGPLFGQGLTFTQDFDDPMRGANPLNNMTVTSGFFGGDVVVNKQAVIEAFNSNCDGTIRGTLTPAVGGQDPGGAIWHSCVIRAIDFRTGANILPDTAKSCKLDFTDSFIRESADFKVAGAGVNFQNVSLRGCTLFESTNVPLIGHNVHCDARGASAWGPFYFGTPDDTGDVSYGTFVIGPVDASALPNPVPIAMPFRLPNNNYAVALDSDDATMLPLGTTARTTLQIDVTVAVNSGNLRATITQVGA